MDAYRAVRRAVRRAVYREIRTGVRLVDCMCLIDWLIDRTGVYMGVRTGDRAEVS
jgi:hypothetical protein